jgi:hypothetical protein
MTDAKTVLDYWRRQPACLCGWVDGHHRELCPIPALERAETRVEGLRTFAQHHHSCASLATVRKTEQPWPPCTCGLEAALAAAREVPDD